MKFKKLKKISEICLKTNYFYKILHNLGEIMSYHKHYTKYQYDSKDGDNNQEVLIRKLISDEDSINFQMLLIEILPKSDFSTADFPYEHDYYVVNGELELNVNNKIKNVNSGDFFYVPGDQSIEIRNSGSSASFLIQISQKSNNSIRTTDFPSFYLKNQSEFEKKTVTNFGSTGTSIQIFNIPKKNFPFIMRRFEIQPGGNIGLHNHPWEHEMFMIHGKMKLFGKDKSSIQTITNEEFIFMPPNDFHGYINDFEELAIFICMIPNINWK